MFLALDGAAVNSSSKSGLISLLKEDFHWVSFIWCFSHRLELGLKDSLKDFIKPLEQSLINLFQLYKRSSKKLRELKQLASILRNVYCFENDSIRPEKATGTRWIDHKMRAMAKLNDKFGVYAAHLANVIADTTKKCDRATLQGKYDEFTEANVLLRSAFLSDLLSPAKFLSLATQDGNIDIITIVNLVRATHEKYTKLAKIYSSHPEKIFEQMPTLKEVLSKINDQNQYQGTKLKYLQREKDYLEGNVSTVIQNIIDCFDQRYGVLIDEVDENTVKESVEGDKMLSDICKILNTKVWPNEVDKQ